VVWQQLLQPTPTLVVAEQTYQLQRTKTFVTLFVCGTVPPHFIALLLTALLTQHVLKHNTPTCLPNLPLPYRHFYYPQAEAFLDRSYARNAPTASHRPDREPFGYTDNGGAMRATPIGLAYSSAPLSCLASAIDSAIGFTHPAAPGLEGALVQAAAVGWLSRQVRGSAGCTPGALLEYLLDSVAYTADMRGKLQTIQQAHASLGQLPQLAAGNSNYAVGGTGTGSSHSHSSSSSTSHSSSHGNGNHAGSSGYGSSSNRDSSSGNGSSSGSSRGAVAVPWRVFWSSREWQVMTHTLNRLTRQNHATLGTEAVAVALWALVSNWEQPRQSVTLATCMGGSTGVTATLTGGWVGEGGLVWVWLARQVCPAAEK
jgi:ADP-ribosylglycohydrolase